MILIINKDHFQNRKWLTHSLNQSTSYTKHTKRESDLRHLQHKWKTTDKYKIWRKSGII
jgi:hypothetical protein